MKYYYFMKVPCYFITILLLFVFTTCTEKSSVQPDGTNNPVTISPQGGEYTFPGGIILRVPPGAVTEDTDVLLQRVSSAKLLPIFERRGVSIDNFLACIQCTPDGITFNQPVQIILSVDLDPGEIPIIHEVNIARGSYTPAETEIICDPEQDTLTISVSHFSESSVEKVKEFKELFDTCDDTLCRCGKIKIKQHDKDYTCNNGNCQVTETDVTITFLDCPGTPPEESVMREVSEGCRPNFHLTAGSTVVATGGQTQVSAHVDLGCEPMDGQSVDFSLSNIALASLNPTYATTNSDGVAHTTFIAGNDEGVVTVTARSTISYYTYTIFASAGGQQETAHGPLITSEKSRRVDIRIEEPDEIWSGTIQYSRNWEVAIHEHAEYEIEFQFFVIEVEDSIGKYKSIHGTATATQDVTLSVSDGWECWTYRDLNAPPLLYLIVGGFDPEDTNELYLWFKRNEDETYFYEYVTCYVCDPENPNNCGDPDGNCTCLDVGNRAMGDTGNVILEEGTYSSSFDFSVMHVSYTLTLQRDQ